MADITYVKISDLTAAQDSQVTDSGLLEMAVVDANGTDGYSSKKVTREQLLSDLKDDITKSASISNTGLITFKNSDNTAVFTLQLPLDGISPEQFGAKGDGVTDDSDALEAALNEAAQAKIPVAMYGNYSITKDLSFTGDCLVAIGSGKIVTNGYKIYGSCGKVLIDGISFEGSLSNADSFLAITDCDDIALKNITIKNAGAYAIAATGTNNGTALIADCYADTVYRDPFRLRNFYNAYAYNNKFVNIGDDCIAFSTESVNGSCVISGNYIENGYGFNILGRSNAVVKNNVFRYARGFIKTGKINTEGRTDCENIIVADNIYKALCPNTAGREFQFYNNVKGLTLCGNTFTDDDTATAPASCVIIGVLNSSPTWSKGFWNVAFNTCENVDVFDNIFGISTGTAFGSTRKFKFTACSDFRIKNNRILRFTTQVVDSSYVGLSGSVLVGNYIDSDPDGNLLSGTFPSVFLQAIANQCLENTFFNVAKITYLNRQRIYFTYSNNTLGGTGGLSITNENVQIDASTHQIVNEPLKAASSMPTSGYYVTGYFVSSLSDNPTLLGWKRLTSGTSHVLNTDWIKINGSN